MAAMCRWLEAVVFVLCGRSRNLSSPAVQSGGQKCGEGDGARGKGQRHARFNREQDNVKEPAM